MDLQVAPPDSVDSLTDKFQSVRAKYNSIALELNTRGIVPPHHRPKMLIDDEHPTAAERLHARDLTVIDLQWFHIHGMKRRMRLS